MIYIGKRPLKILCTLCVLTLFISSCAENNISVYNRDDTFSQVVVQTEHETYSDDVQEILLIIENNAEESTSYGARFQIEKRENGTWRTLPFRENVRFYLLAYTSEPGQSSQMGIDISYLKNKPGKGQFRVLIELGYPYNRFIDDEFTLE